MMRYVVIIMCDVVLQRVAVCDYVRRSQVVCHIVVCGAMHHVAVGSTGSEVGGEFDYRR